MKRFLLLALIIAAPVYAQTSRGTTPVTATGVTSMTFAFPSGTASGDTAVIQIQAEQPITGCTSGGNAWNQVYTDGNSSYTTGSLLYRTLNSSDITAGTAVCSLTATAGGVGFLTSFAGTYFVSAYHGQGAGVSSLAGPTFTVTAPAVALYYTGNRNVSATSAGTMSVSRGSIVGSQLTADSPYVIGALYAETFGSSGNYTPTFTYSPAGNAYAFNIAVVSSTPTVTTTTLTTSQVAYVAGTTVTAQALISPTAATGTVSFMEGGTSLGTCTLVSFAGPGDSFNTPTHKGCTINITPSTGTHTMTAVYSGDTNNQTSTSASYVNVASAVATSPQPCSAMVAGLNGSLGGFVPAINDAYHQRVDGLPADPNSAAILSDWEAGGAYLHIDFGSAEYGYSGIPYYVVDSSVTPGLNFAIANNGTEFYPNDSDVLTTWPGATNTMWLENHYLSPQTDPNVGVTEGDDHLNLLDKHTCTDNETYHTQQKLGSTPALTASSSVIWDMSSRATPQSRAVGITSTEAGGLSVFEGLIRYDEVAAGVISHAIRYQTDRMNCDHFRTGTCESEFTFPATHTADSGSHSAYQHYGLRLRLKSSFNISGYSTANQVILTAMKQYGLLLSDIGSHGYVSGTPDSHWDSDDLVNLQSINVSNFEAVEEPTAYAPDRYPAGTAAAITTFTASPASVASGSCATLTTSTTNASYNIIDGAGFFGTNTASPSVCPTATTTYNLTTTNQFLAVDDGFQDGHRNTASTTVTVTSAPVAPTITFTVAHQSPSAFPFSFTVGATSNSSGAFTYSVVSGPATNIGAGITVTGAGTVVLLASQAASGSFTNGSQTASFTVTAPAMQGGGTGVQIQGCLVPN